MTVFPLGSSPRRLAELDEARGFLESVSSLDGITVARFAWGSVALPEELEPELAGMVGKQCAILRLDGKYHVRTV